MNPLITRCVAGCLFAAFPALLSGCATIPESDPQPAIAASATVPTTWQAPLPHEGRLTELNAWWEQFDDPLLSRLITAAQDVSPDIAAAASRIAQAQAIGVSAGAAMVPAVKAESSVARGRDDLMFPTATTQWSGVRASWELDLFGSRRAAAAAARARVESAQASWHDARVSVAAEVATTYSGLRACEAQLIITTINAESRDETARLMEVSARSGLQAPANVALSHASAAQGRADVIRQREQCDLTLKSLVALTGMEETELRNQLVADTARVPRPAELKVASVPAQALAQRPDLFSAAREVLAASADMAESRAQFFPRISLSGSIGPGHADSSLGTMSGTLWNIGPVSVSLPVFDGGVRRANLQAARARYDEAVSLYQAKLRAAIREVEQALVTLQSTVDQSADVQMAAQGYRASFIATDSRQRGGMASVFELEDARRTDLQAQSALVDLQHARVSAWISLYRALGGGWQASAHDAATRGAHTF
jgi:NodT family efflux transporter outer membrane factor (OMF) lipoprotein